MSVSESQRHQLFQWLEGAMGSERAATMMVTKADLDNMRVGLEARMEHEFARMQKRIYLSMLASPATVVGLVLAVLQVR